MRIIKRLLAIRIIRFGLTGGIATLTHILVAFSALRFLEASVFTANIAGFCSAFSLSYLMQSLFVFQKSLTLQNAGRFFIVQASALLVSQLISECLSGVNDYIRVLFVVFLLPVITYVIHKVWTYKHTESTERTE